MVQTHDQQIQPGIPQLSAEPIDAGLGIIWSISGLWLNYVWHFPANNTNSDIVPVMMGSILLWTATRADQEEIFFLTPNCYGLPLPHNMPPELLDARDMAYSRWGIPGTL